MNQWMTVFLLLGVCGVSQAQAEEIKADPDKLPVTVGAFVDSYYGFDSTNPRDHERQIFTQARRSNEFNVNLAHIDAKVDANRVHGRLALQAGTSVQNNYSSEPSMGATSGAALARHLQEAYAGYRVADKLWIDAGIYFAYIGLESWISKDNWNYTRSFTADYTPYYLSGVRATYQWSDVLTTQFHVMNGWQIISENNGGKAIGAQVVVTPSSKFAFYYNTYFGHDVTSFGMISPRIFNQLIAKVALTSAMQVALTADLGMQKKVGETGYLPWHSVTATGQYRFSPTYALGLRGENYQDPHQVLIGTGSSNGLRAWGASVNLDIQPHPSILWRNEVRETWANDRVFVGSIGTASSSQLFVSSLSLSI